MVKENGEQMESERWMNSECMESVWYLNGKQNLVSAQWTENWEHQQSTIADAMWTESDCWTQDEKSIRRHQAFLLIVNI